MAQNEARSSPGKILGFGDFFADRRQPSVWAESLPVWERWEFRARNWDRI